MRRSKTKSISLTKGGTGASRTRRSCPWTHTRACAGARDPVHLREARGEPCGSDGPPAGRRRGCNAAANAKILERGASIIGAALLSRRGRRSPRGYGSRREARHASQSRTPTTPRLGRLPRPSRSATSTPRAAASSPRAKARRAPPCSRVNLRVCSVLATPPRLRALEGRARRAGARAPRLRGVAGGRRRHPAGFPRPPRLPSPSASDPTAARRARETAPRRRRARRISSTSTNLGRHRAQRWPAFGADAPRAVAPLRRSVLSQGPSGVSLGAVFDLPVRPVCRAGPRIWTVLRKLGFHARGRRAVAGRDGPLPPLRAAVALGRCCSAPRGPGLSPGAVMRCHESVTIPMSTSTGADSLKRSRRPPPSCSTRSRAKRPAGAACSNRRRALRAGGLATTDRSRRRRRRRRTGADDGAADGNRVCRRAPPPRPGSHAP